MYVRQVWRMCQGWNLRATKKAPESDAFADTFDTICYAIQAAFWRMAPRAFQIHLNFHRTLFAVGRLSLD